MIALPGLTLYSGREKECLEILKTFAKHEKEGVIPNFIGNTPETTAYNSADAGLWFAWAIQKYLEKTEDYKSVKKFLWPTLQKIFLHYKKGTLFNIKMLENGLLRAGTKDTQVTWMDATAYGKPVTPRNGCPIEINALWYNLVCFVDELGSRFHDKITKRQVAATTIRHGKPNWTDSEGRPPEGLRPGMAEIKSSYRSKEQTECSQNEKLLQFNSIKETEILMDKISLSFNKHFWIIEKNYLADVYKEDGSIDTSLRPNQIFAISLPFSLLSGERAQSVLKIVEEELLTPGGLRTLSPKNKDYHTRYEGGSGERDSAYHNGTVWPWLIGHFGEALMKVSSDKKKVALKLEKILQQFEAHLEEAGLFSVSEIFDGNSPHHPHGCISQAWSVAELLRLSYLVKKKK